MFAGHLLLTIFMIATWYLRACPSACCTPRARSLMVFFVFLLETLVSLLQAFIFTTLTATYIARLRGDRPLTRTRLP